MKTQTAELVINTITTAKYIVEKSFDREIDETTDDGRLQFLYALSSLLLLVANDDEIRSKIQNIINDLGE